MSFDRNKLLEMLDEDNDNDENNNSNIKKEKKGKDIDTRKEFIINLHSIPDQMESTWWCILDPVYFTLTSKIPLLSSCKVKEGCILIQKLKPESGFIQLQYYYVDIKGEVIYMGKNNNCIKPYLNAGLMDYVLTHNKLPHKCTYIQAFKNGNVQIDFNPNKFDKYSLKIGKKRGLALGIDNLETFFSGLKQDVTKEAEYVGKTTKINPDNVISKRSEDKSKEQQKRFIEETQISTHLKKNNEEIPNISESLRSNIKENMKKEKKESSGDIDISNLLY